MIYVNCREMLAVLVVHFRVPEGTVSHLLFSICAVSS